MLINASLVIDDIISLLLSWGQNCAQVWVTHLLPTMLVWWSVSSKDSLLFSVPCTSGGVLDQYWYTNHFFLIRIFRFKNDLSLTAFMEKEIWDYERSSIWDYEQVFGETWSDFRLHYQDHSAYWNIVACWLVTGLSRFFFCWPHSRHLSLSCGHIRDNEASAFLLYTTSRTLTLVEVSLSEVGRPSTLCSGMTHQRYTLLTRQEIGSLFTCRFLLSHLSCDYKESWIESCCLPGRYKLLWLLGFALCSLLFTLYFCVFVFCAMCFLVLYVSLFPFWFFSFRSFHLCFHRLMALCPLLILLLFRTKGSTKGSFWLEP